jgi:hypothetical protein
MITGDDTAYRTKREIDISAKINGKTIYLSRKEQKENNQREFGMKISKTGIIDTLRNQSYNSPNNVCHFLSNFANFDI